MNGVRRLWAVVFVVAGAFPGDAAGQEDLLPLYSGAETRLSMRGRTVVGTVVSTAPDSITFADEAANVWVIYRGFAGYQAIQRSGPNSGSSSALSGLDVSRGRQAYGAGKGLLLGSLVGSAGATLFAFFATGAGTDNSPGLDTAEEAWAPVFLAVSAVVGGVAGGVVGWIIGRSPRVRWEPIPLDRGT
jgi:hypothetical protein